MLTLELQIKSLTDSQGERFPGYGALFTLLAAEFGISTKKAEELAKNTGVMMVKLKVALSHLKRNSRRRPGWCCVALNANTDRRTVPPADWQIPDERGIPK